MPKLSKADIKSKLAEWESLSKKIAKAQETMETEMVPAVRRFAVATKPIREHWDPKIAKLTEQRAAVQKEVTDWLKSQKKDVAVETDTAIAERTTGLGPRVIDIKKFFEAAKSKSESAIHECINVLIDKAEKLLGKKEVDAISDRFPKKDPTTQLRLK